jgi:hypothetical protein
MKPEFLTEHVFNEFKRVLSSRVEDIEILGETPDEKDPEKKPYIVIEARSFDPAARADGKIELAQAWEIRVMVPLLSSANSLRARYAARDYSWKIGAIFHDSMFDGYDTGESIHVQWLGSEDDNVDLEAQSFESWRSDFLVRVNVGEEIFLKWEAYPENGEKAPEFPAPPPPAPKKEQFDIWDQFTTPGRKGK